MNDDFPKIALLIGGAFFFCLWMALLAGWCKASGWLMMRKSRVAVVAGGAMWLSLCLLAITGYWSMGDTLGQIAAGFWAFMLAVGLWVVVARLRQLRPARVPEPAPRPALPKPPERPLLPRRPDAARIEAARLRIAGRRR